MTRRTCFSSISRDTVFSSPAAEFNCRVMKRLKRALEKDPQADLATHLPTEYSSRLAKMAKRGASAVQSRPPVLTEEGTTSQKQHESKKPECFNGTFHDPVQARAVIIRPLSHAVRRMFESVDEHIDFHDGKSIASTLSTLVRCVDVIWRSTSGNRRWVGKCSADIVVKVTTSTSDLTECTSLEYLERQRPCLPVPRVHGLVVCNGLAYLFISFLPGSTLCEVWPLLTISQKEAIRDQLDSILSDLRQLKRPNGMALGGVGGEGCKDARRSIRICTRAIFSNEDFWKFQYLEAPVGSSIYLTSLRKITQPLQASQCVFTHGDLRTSNIIVYAKDDGFYNVSGIIDWEMSGFYPEDFECTKVTNNLATDEISDWYLFLPACVSPEKYPCRWLADFAWDKQVV